MDNDTFMAIVESVRADLEKLRDNPKLNDALRDMLASPLQNLRNSLDQLER